MGGFDVALIEVCRAFHERAAGELFHDGEGDRPVPIRSLFDGDWCHQADSVGVPDEVYFGKTIRGLFCRTHAFVYQQARIVRPDPARPGVTFADNSGLCPVSPSPSAVGV